MIIRKLQLSDLPALVVLDKACFDKPWSEASLREELVHANSLNLGISSLREGVADEAIHGLPRSKAPRNDEFLVAAILTRLVGDERWIFRIMTHPDYRRQGLAQKLLEVLPREPLWLEVSEYNQSAIRFYEQAGFKIVAKRPGYYPEDAWVMKSETRESFEATEPTV